jgi:hypothetical protein
LTQAEVSVDAYSARVHRHQRKFTELASTMFFWI